MDVTTDDSLDTMKFRSHRRCPRECTLHDILDLEKKKSMCGMCVCGRGGGILDNRKKRKESKKEIRPDSLEKKEET